MKIQNCIIILVLHLPFEKWQLRQENNNKVNNIHDTVHIIQHKLKQYDYIIGYL